MLIAVTIANDLQREFKFSTERRNEIKEWIESLINNIPPEEAFKQIIGHYDDPNREGLKDTPKRYLKMLRELTTPIPFEYTLFDSEGADEMITIKDIPFYSLCEHHTIPFFGHGWIAYVPNGKILGLSKLARTLEFYSKGFQNQERITNKVAKAIMDVPGLSPKGVAVVLKAEHLCMGMRGVNKPGAQTVTSSMQGIFRTDKACRDEFLSFVV